MEEIKAKYGRGRKDAGSVGAQMGDNLAAMQQRGERIAEIERRAEEMREDAAGFAALAKELNRRM